MNYAHSALLRGRRSLQNYLLSNDLSKEEAEILELFSKNIVKNILKKVNDSQKLEIVTYTSKPIYHFHTNCFNYFTSIPNGKRYATLESYRTELVSKTEEIDDIHKNYITISLHNQTTIGNIFLLQKEYKDDEYHLGFKEEDNRDSVASLCENQHINDKINNELKKNVLENLDEKLRNFIIANSLVDSSVFQHIANISADCLIETYIRYKEKELNVDNEEMIYLVISKNNIEISPAVCNFDYDPREEY